MTTLDPLNYAAIVERCCTGKRRYYEKKVAIRCARRVRQRTGGDVRHYTCLICGYLHVGHPPSPESLDAIREAAAWARGAR